jgi:hypothetical protein
VCFIFINGIFSTETLGYFTDAVINLVPMELGCFHFDILW